MGISVSVVVPVYNVEHYLTACLDSLTTQTLKNIEVIIVDDGSIDSSAKIAQSYADRFDNIYFYSKVNEGPGAARNFGLNHVKGKYVTFLDSDDALTVDACEKLFNAAERHQCDIVAGRSVWRRKDQADEAVEYYESWFNKNLNLNFRDDPAFAASFVIPTSKLFSTALIKENNLSFPYIIGEDVPFSFYTFYYAANIRLIPDIVYLRTERNSYSNLSVTQTYSSKTIIDRVKGNRLIDEFCNKKEWSGMWKYYIPHLLNISKLMIQIREESQQEEAFQYYKAYIEELPVYRKELILNLLGLSGVQFTNMQYREFVFQQYLKYEFVPKAEWKSITQWNVELLNAKQWLEQQLKTHQEEITKQAQVIQELRQWIHQLEEGKSWLESRCSQLEGRLRKDEL